MAHVDGDVKSIDKTKDEIREPGMFKVIFLNDNYTPMDFVVEVLLKIFDKSELDAYRIMQEVHNNGQGTAGIYIEDIAQTKHETVRKVAKDNGFPLKTKVLPV